MKQNGLMLSEASEELQGDREVVLCAKRTGLRSHASEHLKRDRGVVLCAVKTHGAARVCLGGATSRCGCGACRMGAGPAALKFVDRSDAVMAELFSRLS